MLDIFLQYKKQILILISILAAIGIIAVGFQLYLLKDREGKVAVKVTAVPNDATIVLNNSQTITPGEQWLSPGSYSVVAHKDGFEDSKITFLVSKQSRSRLSISLTPLSNEAKKWARDNQDLYVEDEEEGGEEAIKYGETFQQTNPIVAELPYEDPYYTIGYRSPDDKSVELTITAPSALYRYYALQKIRDLGFDPADYKIIYNNYKDQL